MYDLHSSIIVVHNSELNFGMPLEASLHFWSEVIFISRDAIASLVPGMLFTHSH